MRTHQLETTLRSLALSGMLDTLDVRLSQANAGELGHVEFLQTLCEDELARRDAAGIARRVRAAHFEQTCALEDYDFSFNPKIPAARIRDLATLRFVEAGESVVLHGPVGVGKSMIAQALGHHVDRHVIPWRRRHVIPSSGLRFMFYSMAPPPCPVGPNRRRRSPARA